MFETILAFNFFEHLLWGGVRILPALPPSDPRNGQDDRTSLALLRDLGWCAVVAPLLDERNHAVLSELAYSETEIARLTT